MLLWSFCHAFTKETFVWVSALLWFLHFNPALWSCTALFMHKCHIVVWSFIFFRIIVYPFFPNENYNRFGYDMVWWMHKEMISYSLTALPCKMHGCLALLPQSQAVDEKMPLAQDTSWWLRWGPCVWQQWLIQCYISGEGWYSHHVYSDQHIKRIFEPSMAHPS